ncbi:hypothetical protein CYMTET_42635 [Cymbomonas tetramitiformis]|uniref:Uncharacterized protein n=1 Tax=Cymbomonas tetramitiformis TaxID=36881 RepID=A0AAE0F0S9_9CHLO|nr:hypothetical protein CYMTET_42635 [Cymbomonas tetramitiformis]
MLGHAFAAGVDTGFINCYFHGRLTTMDQKYNMQHHCNTNPWDKRDGPGPRPFQGSHLVHGAVAVCSGLSRGGLILAKTGLRCAGPGMRQWLLLLAGTGGGGVVGIGGGRHADEVEGRMGAALLGAEVYGRGCRQGRVPAEVREWLASTRLVATLKDELGVSVRPMACGAVRKLMAKGMCKQRAQPFRCRFLWAVAGSACGRARLASAVGCGQLGLFAVRVHTVQAALHWHLQWVCLHSGVSCGPGRGTAQTRRIVDVSLGELETQGWT